MVGGPGVRGSRPQGQVEGSPQAGHAGLPRRARQRREWPRGWAGSGTSGGSGFCEPSPSQQAEKQKFNHTGVQSYFQPWGFHPKSPKRSGSPAPV